MATDATRRRQGDLLRSIAGCVLACIALAACARQGPVAGAGAGAGAQAAVATSVSYAVRPDVVERASATPGDAALVVAVRRSQGRDGATTLGEARNARLFPARDPLDRAGARLVRLAAEVSGFTVVVDYDFPDGPERFTLGFQADACEAPAVALPSTCVWRLRHYRRERLDAQGQLASGIVADYAEGRARLLDHAVRPLRSTPMQTVPLRAGPAPSLQELGSVFDFSPALDLPVIR